MSHEEFSHERDVLRIHEGRAPETNLEGIYSRRTIQRAYGESHESIYWPQTIYISPQGDVVVRRETPNPEVIMGDPMLGHHSEIVLKVWPRKPETIDAETGRISEPRQFKFEILKFRGDLRELFMGVVRNFIDPENIDSAFRAMMEGH